MSPQSQRIRTQRHEELRGLRYEIAAFRGLQALLDKQKLAAARKFLRMKGYLR